MLPLYWWRELYSDSFPTTFELLNIKFFKYSSYGGLFVESILRLANTASLNPSELAGTEFLFCKVPRSGSAFFETLEILARIAPTELPERLSLWIRAPFGVDDPTFPIWEPVIDNPALVPWRKPKLPVFPEAFGVS